MLAELSYVRGATRSEWLTWFYRIGSGEEERRDKVPALSFL